MPTKNIVVFGKSGVGKSSVINLMAGEEKVVTSSDACRCTNHWQEVSIAFDGYDYKVFDTVAPEDSHIGIEGYLSAVVNIRSLIMKLENEGGTDLLLFCIRGSQISATIQNNYRMFYEWLFEKKVPIVLVITGLEREQKMEDWWIRYGRSSFDKCNIVIDGHECVTAASELGSPDARYPGRRLYEESRHLVRNVIRKHTYDRPVDGWRLQGRGKDDDRWLRFMRCILRELGLAITEKDIISALIDYCGVPPEAAVEIAREVTRIK